MVERGTAPPGWDYNPSDWDKRLPIVLMAAMGFFISAYLALYQLDVFPTVFEPFFDDGSRRVLTSEVSYVLPVPDAALGALAYLADVVLGLAGGRERWRSLPWAVLTFGFVVGPLGAVSVLLVILQPVLLDAWCTLCLASAAVSVLMIGPAMDEVLACLQHLRRQQRAGASLLQSLLGTRSAETVRGGV